MISSEQFFAYLPTYILLFIILVIVGFMIMFTWVLSLNVWINIIVLTMFYTLLTCALSDDDDVYLAWSLLMIYLVEIAVLAIIYYWAYQPVNTIYIEFS